MATAAVLATAASLGLAGTALAGPSPVLLGTAGSFAVLAGSTVTNTGPSTISGDVGVNPGTAVTGFPPGQVSNGTIHVADGVAAQAQSDAATAFGDAAGRPSNGTIAGDLAGRTLVAGVYSSPSTLELSGTLTLDGQGDPGAVFIFQVGSALTVGAGSRVSFVGGAQACNVVFQVGSSATIGTNSAFAGTVLADQSISLATGATLDGRALARNAAVTLDTNRITAPTCAASSGPATPGPTGSGPGGTTTTDPGTAPTGDPTSGGEETGTGTPTTTPLRGFSMLSGPGGLVTRPFTVRVTGRAIAVVRFFVDNRLVATVRARPGRRVFALRVDPRTQGPGVHRITARVVYGPRSGTPPRTHRRTYRRAGPTPVAPRFTG